MTTKTTYKKVLVTGGTGFIGSYLIKKLVEIGCEVRVLVRANSNIDILKDISNVHFIKGDIQDMASMKMAAKGIDVVYHLAAKLHLPMDSNDPELYATNVVGTKNLLDACISENVSIFIFFSSAAVMFGSHNNVMDESTPCHPSAKYGKTKLEAEMIVNDYHKKYGLITTILRPVVVYGVGERGNVIKFIDSIYKRQFQIIGNGRYVRSLVHVRNLVNAALLIIGNPVADGKTYVVTDKDNLTIEEMARIIALKLDVPLPLFHIPKSIAFFIASGCELIEKVFKIRMPLNRDLVRRLTMNQICSSQKIQKELELTPTGFDEGISETIDAYLARMR